MNLLNSVNAPFSLKVNNKDYSPSVLTLGDIVELKKAMRTLSITTDLKDFVLFGEGSVLALYLSLRHEHKELSIEEVANWVPSIDITRAIWALLELDYDKTIEEINKENKIETNEETKVEDPKVEKTTEIG